MIAGMGKHFKYRDLEFWAENGSICVIDYRKEPPEYKTDSAREFLLRAQERINERNRIQHKIQIGAGSMGPRVAAQEVEEIQKCIEGMIQCVRIAKHQGDPHDPRVQEHIRKHGDPNRKIIIPTGLQVAEYNRPTPLPTIAARARGRRTLNPEDTPSTLREYRGG